MATMIPLTETAAESVAGEVLREAADAWSSAGTAGAWSLLMQDEFTDDWSTLAELRSVAAVARLYLDRNPLIRRAQALRHTYVWGCGVQIQVRVDEGAPTDVNDVLQAFLDDDSNAEALTSSEAHHVNEAALGTDGNIFLALFTNPLTGRVQVRRLPFEQIEETVRNPDDATEVWYYRRERTVPPPNGQAGPGVRVVTYHPALNYRPVLRPKAWGTDRNRGDILWDAPVKHIRVNRQSGRLWGLGDLHAALPWARAYTVFLEDWARLAKALAQFAWKATAPSQSRATQMAAQLLALQDQTSLPGTPAGATAVLTPGQDLAPIPKTGATIDANSGKPLAAMVASATDVPLTMLLGDPGTTGARAVAETLDQPTRLANEARRDLWRQVFQELGGYVLDQAVKAPRGPLNGTVRIDPYTGRQRIEIAGGLDRTIEVIFPPLDDTPLDMLVAAIVAADTTGKLPPRVIATLLAQALRVQDADEVIDAMFDDQGVFIDPRVTAAEAAARRERNGEPGSQAVEAYR